MKIPLDNFKQFSKETKEINESLTNLQSLTSWDDKFRLLMLAGKKYPTPSGDLKNEDFLIRGCESKAWLTTMALNNQVLFLAYSESKIIRGLLTVLISEINLKSKDYILNFEAEKLFEKLGLERQLSESRKGGLHNLWKEIKTLVSQI